MAGAADELTTFARGLYSIARSSATFSMIVARSAQIAEAAGARVKSATAGIVAAAADARAEIQATRALAGSASVGASSASTPAGAASASGVALPGFQPAVTKWYAIAQAVAASGNGSEFMTLVQDRIQRVVAGQLSVAAMESDLNSQLAALAPSFAKPTATDPTARRLDQELSYYIATKQWGISSA